MLTCIKCGDNVEGKSFCSNCGERVEKKIFCTNCGNCVTGENFCGTCGVAVGTPQPYPYSQEYYGNAAGFVSGPPTKKSLSTKSKIIIGAAGFVVLAAIIVVVIVLSGGTTERPLSVQELLEVAERYLLEGNYEQALVEFIRVIEVDPMEPRGYTGAAEAYVELDRIDDALDVLHQGLGVLPDNPEILNALSVIEDTLAPEYEDALAPEYIITRTATITVHSIIEQDAWRIAYAEHLRNYSLTQVWGEYVEPSFTLIDINNDGMPELFISDYVDYQDVWFNIYTFDHTTRTVVYVGRVSNVCNICAWTISNNSDFPGLFLCSDPARGVDRVFITKNNNQIESRYATPNSSLYDVYLDSRNDMIGLVVSNYERNEANIQLIILDAELATLQFNVREETVSDDISGVSTDFRVNNINGVNYFNLRDVAYAFDGTENQFSISGGGIERFTIEVGKPNTPGEGFIRREVEPAVEWKVIEFTINVEEEEGRIVTSLYRNGSYYFRLYDIKRMLGIETDILPPLNFPTTILGGIDYALVFDLEFYRNYNRDVAEAFGDDAVGILTHFVNNGMSEGRIAHPNFNVHVYRENNADLVDAFGDDLRAYFLHYINHGHNEGRVAY